MAVLSDYTTGTVAIAVNSTTVTGTGTAWNLTSLGEGDTLLINNLTAVISTVNSATSITITRPWTGGAISGAAYRARYMADGARYSNIMKELLNTLNDGTVAALAAAGSAANKIAYYTGSGAAALTDIAAKGRSLLASTTTIDLILKLGPVIGGNPPEPSQADVGMVNGDFNTVIYGGRYTIAGNWTNGPDGAASAAYIGVMDVVSRNTNNLFWQILYRNNGVIYRRRSNATGGSTWDASWVVIDAPTVGTASQSGGVPTGAIIERGSNANGDYVRFADGTQICSTNSLTSGTVTAVTGSLFTSSTVSWTYPIGFFSAPCVIGGQSTVFNRWVSPISPFSSTCQIRLFSTFTSAVDSTFGVTAIGRWFA